MLHLLVPEKYKKVGVNNIKSTFKEIISEVAQGSIVGPILFNIIFNDFFHFVLVTLAHNFAYDNTLSSFNKAIENLINILESEGEIAIIWFKDNRTILNTVKFQAKSSINTKEIILTKS